MARPTEDLTPPPITPEVVSQLLALLDPNGQYSPEGYGNDPTTQTQDTPPNSRDLGYTAQEAAHQIPSDGAGAFRGPGGTADRFIRNIPLLGGIEGRVADFTNPLIEDTIRKGPVGRDLFGLDPAHNAITAMPDGPEKRQAYTDEVMQDAYNFAVGSIGGAGNKATKAAQSAAEKGAFELQQAIQRVLDLTRSGTSRKVALDAVEKEFPKVKIGDVQTGSLGQQTSGAAPFAKSAEGAGTADVAAGILPNLPGAIADATKVAGRAAPILDTSAADRRAGIQDVLGAAGDRFVSKPIAGTSRFDVVDTTTNKSIGISAANAEAADAVAAKRNARFSGEASAPAPIPEPPVPARPKANPITKLSDDQLATLREVPDLPPATAKVVDAEMQARALAKFTSPENTAISVARQVHGDVTEALAKHIVDAPDAVPTAKEVVGAFANHIDDAIVSLNQKPTKALRTAAAESLITDANASAVRRIAAQDAKTAALAQRAEQIVQEAKAGVPPVKTVNDTIDAMAEHAQPQLFHDPYPGGVTPPAALSDAERAAAAGRVRSGNPQETLFREPYHGAVEPQSIPNGGGGGNMGLPPTRPPFNLKDFAKNAIPEFAQAIRGIVAGADFSAAGRQAFPFLFAHPLSYIKGVGRGVQAMFQTDEALARVTNQFRVDIEKTGISAGRDGLYLAEKGGGLVKGEERFAGVEHLLGKVPIVGGIYGATERAYTGTLNAVRAYSYLGAVKTYERFGTLDLTTKQQIAKDINIMSGQGFKLDPANTSEVVMAVAKLSNGLGFSPKFFVARARLIPETVKAFTNMAWDAGHGHAPSPNDIEQVRLGLGYAAGVASIWQVANAAGLKIEFDPHNTNFGKIDLGKVGDPNIAAAVGLMETFGFATQSYGGRVYMDPGQGIGQDIKLLVQLFTNQATGLSGKTYRPWDHKFGENSAFDLVMNFFENKAAPVPSAAIRTAKGQTGDTGDITANPITSMLLPLIVQGTLSASGATEVGGPLHADWVPGADTAADAEKTRLKRDIPAAPGVIGLPGDKQIEYADTTAAAVEKVSSALIKTPEYAAATDAQKQDMLIKVQTAARNAAQKDFGLKMALSGQNVTEATAIALSGAQGNVGKGEVLRQIADAGKLTPDVIAKIDGQRNQTDPKKPFYDLAVNEYIKVKQLSDSWVQAPAFNFGTPGEWAAAERLRTQYMKLQKEFPPTKDGTVTIPNPKVEDFYYNNGNLSLFYTKAGSRKTNLISDERKAIEQEPLWSHVGKTPDATQLVATAP